MEKSEETLSPTDSSILYKTKPPEVDFNKDNEAEQVQTSTVEVTPKIVADTEPTTEVILKIIPCDKVFMRTSILTSLFIRFIEVV